MDESMMQNQLPDLKQYFHHPGTPFLLPQLSFTPNNYQSPQPGHVPQEYLPPFQDYSVYCGDTGGTSYYFAPHWQPLATQGQSLPGSTPYFGTTAGNMYMFPSTANAELPNTFSLCPSTSISGTQEGDATFAAVSQPLPTTESLYGRSLQDVTKGFESLSAQLANLDRYMAMHTFELDSNSKKNLVAQRMELVRELDLKRQFKEQLEAGLGQQESKAQMTTTPSLQPAFPQLRSEDLQNSLNVASPSWTSATTINNSPFIWTHPTINIAQGLMPPGNEAPSKSIPHQFPALGSIIGFSNTLNYEEIRPSVSIPYENQSTDPFTDGNNIQIARGHKNTHNYFGLNVHTDNGEWSTPTQPAPPEISRIHRKIEETAKRSEPLDELLKELTIVTTKLKCQQQRLRLLRTNLTSTDEDDDGKSYYSSSLSTTQETK
jgi:hypothetical protein